MPAVKRRQRKGKYDKRMDENKAQRCRFCVNEVKSSDGNATLSKLQSLLTEYKKISFLSIARAKFMCHDINMREIRMELRTMYTLYTTEMAQSVLYTSMSTVSIARIERMVYKCMRTHADDQ